MTVAKRTFAPSLRRATSAPSTRRSFVLTLLYGNAIVTAFLALVLVADTFFDFLQLGEPLGARLAGVVSLVAWSLINAWTGRQVLNGTRKGYRYGLILFSILLVQELLVGARSVPGIVIALLCVAALVSIRDELTN